MGHQSIVRLAKNLREERPAWRASVHSLDSPERQGKGERGRTNYSIACHITQRVQESRSKTTPRISMENQEHFHMHTAHRAGAKKEDDDNNTQKNTDHRCIFEAMKHTMRKIHTQDINGIPILRCTHKAGTKGW